MGSATLQLVVETYLLTFAAVFCRLAGFAVLMPFLKHGAVPSRVFVALLVHASIVVVLGTGPMSASPPQDPVAWFLLLAPEVLLGLGLGVVTRAVLAAAQGMGTFVSQSIGLAFATFIDPGTQSSMQVVDRLTWTVMLLLLLATDSHLLLMQSLLDTFRIAPVGHAPMLDGLAIARWGSQVFVASLRLAAPALSVGFMIYVVLAILARVAPQMNLFAFGFALTIPSGIFALGLSSQHAVAMMADLLARLPEGLRALVAMSL